MDWTGFVLNDPHQFLEYYDNRTRYFLFMDTGLESRGNETMSNWEVDSDSDSSQVVQVMWPTYALLPFYLYQRLFFFLACLHPLEISIHLLRATQVYCWRVMTSRSTSVLVHGLRELTSLSNSLRDSAYVLCVWISMTQGLVTCCKLFHWVTYSSPSSWSTKINVAETLVYFTALMIIAAPIDYLFSNFRDWILGGSLEQGQRSEVAGDLHSLSCRDTFLLCEKLREAKVGITFKGFFLIRFRFIVALLGTVPTLMAVITANRINK